MHYSEGSSLGPLNYAMVVDQFTRLRDGDSSSWWYENPGVLDAPTLNQIKATTWVCRRGCLFLPPQTLHMT